MCGIGWPLTLRGRRQPHAGFCRGHPRLDRRQSDGRLFWLPPDGPILMDAHGLGGKLLIDNFAIAFDGEIQRLIGTERFLDFDLLPGGIGDVFDATILSPIWIPASRPACWG